MRVEEGRVFIEGDIDKSHITMGIKKEHQLPLLYPEVTKKYVFDNARGKFGEGKRVILDKSIIFKDLRRKGEERQGGKEIVKGNSATKGSKQEPI